MESLIVPKEAKGKNQKRDEDTHHEGLLHQERQMVIVHVNVSHKRHRNIT